MGYLSSDKFQPERMIPRMHIQTGMRTSNGNIISVIHPYAVFTAGIDHYQYSVSSTKVPVNAYKLSFDINQIYLRADFSYSPNNKHISPMD